MSNKRDILEAAMRAWQEQAMVYRMRGNTARVHSCEREVQALEIERDTGVAVCSCCSAEHEAIDAAYPTHDEENPA
jgi:predicted Zn-dependent protease